jgi:hypothetical protein
LGQTYNLFGYDQGTAKIKNYFAGSFYFFVADYEVFN